MWISTQSWTWQSVEPRYCKHFYRLISSIHILIPRLQSHSQIVEVWWVFYSFLAQDGTCIIHTVRHGRYMYTLPRKSIRSKCEIHEVAISGLGRIVVYSEDPLGRSKVWNGRTNVEIMESWVWNFANSCPIIVQPLALGLSTLSILSVTAVNFYVCRLF